MALHRHPSIGLAGKRDHTGSVARHVVDEAELSALSAGNGNLTLDVNVRFAGGPNAPMLKASSFSARQYAYCVAQRRHSVL
jgi:hypothetical protein